MRDCGWKLVKVIYNASMKCILDFNEYILILYCKMIFFQEYEVYQLDYAGNSERQRAVDNQSIIALEYGSLHSGTVTEEWIWWPPSEGEDSAILISSSIWSAVGLR